MAGCAGDACCVDRYAGAVFAAAGRLLFAANRKMLLMRRASWRLIEIRQIDIWTGDQMSTEVVMPQMGESIAEGTITKVVEEGWRTRRTR